MLESSVPAALIAVLVCPVCYQYLAEVRGGAIPSADSGATVHSSSTAVWLRCVGCARHYPVQDGLPVLLEERATFQPFPG